ncbi:MAG: glutathione S-transferase [Sulfurifustaceae bacterium]
MVTVHHLNNSRSQRILWLLEELGVEYDIKRYQRESTGLAPASLLAVHPLGKSPVVTDGDQTLAESGAVIEYLVERYGKDRLVPPPGTPERLRYTYWLHFAEGSAMPPLVMALVFTRLKQQAPLLVRPIARAIADRALNSFVQPNIDRQLDYMERELQQKPWFAGSEFTAADVQMSFPLEAAAVRGGLNASRPKLMQWLERIHTRPAYRRALERGGKYELLR